MAFVPDVLGETQASAESTITSANLSVGTIGHDYSESVPFGQVIVQNPPPDSSVPQGYSVDFTISDGPAPVSIAVPDVTGLPQATAETTITGAGLSVGEVTRQSSDVVPVDTVISQDPAAGTSVATAAAIALTVSSGPAATGGLPPDPADVAPPLAPGQVNSL